MSWSLGGKYADLIDDCFKWDTIEEIIKSLEEKTKDSDPEVCLNFTLDCGLCKG
jgi:hypothetical protein